MHLALIHQSPAGAALPHAAVVWRTCLREIAFLPEPTHDLTSRVVRDGDAYALLVEVVSGLRSPLVGETEVQAQFKAFLASLDAALHAPLLRLGQQVLRDAKTIRRAHLQGVGAHSYGKLAVRYIRQHVRVAVVGTGALASEVIDALHRDVAIDQWGRHEPTSLPAGAQKPLFRPLTAARDAGIVSADTAALVIAAPAMSVDLDAIARCYSALDTVVDLRAERERTPLDAVAFTAVVTLEDLFTDAAADSVAARRVGAARADIAQLGQAYDRQEELHPFGWDDVCA